MKLQSVVESLDDISEELRENYEQHDGKFRLVQTVGLVAEKDQDQFTELKGALDKQRNDTKTASKQFQDLTSSIEALGGLDALKELTDQQAQDERSNLEKKGQYDKLLDQVKLEHGQEIEKKDRTIAGLRTRLDKEKRGREVMEAIAKHDGNPKLLQPILMQQTRLAGEDDGEDLRVEVYLNDTMQVDGEGKALTVEGYVQRLRDDDGFAGAFKGTGNSGGGGSGDHPPGGPGGGGGNGGGIPPDLKNFRRSTATPIQRISARKAIQAQLGGDLPIDDPQVERAYAALPE